MRYAKIYDCSISEGPGFRVALFLQGCSFHCKGCHNKELWEFNGGKEWISDVEELVVCRSTASEISGLSVLGGEPLESRNLLPLYTLFRKIKEKDPTKTIWLWTGYDFDSLDDYQFELIDQWVDVLITNPFDITKKSRDLKWAGSTNQLIWKKENNKWVCTPIE